MDDLELEDITSEYGTNEEIFENYSVDEQFSESEYLYEAAENDNDTISEEPETQQDSDISRQNLAQEYFDIAKSFYDEQDFDAAEAHFIKCRDIYSEMMEKGKRSEEILAGYAEACGYLSLLTNDKNLYKDSFSVYKQINIDKKYSPMISFFNTTFNHSRNQNIAVISTIAVPLIIFVIYLFVK